MKRFISSLLVLITIFALLSTLTSCGASYKKTESDYLATTDELIEHFVGLGYFVDGYNVSTYPDTDDDIYYMLTVVTENASKKRYNYGMDIAICGTQKGAVQYCEYHIDGKRTILDEVFEIIATEFKPFSKYAVYGNLVIMYNYDSDYKEVVNYLKSVDD